jgi:DNA-binding CsgD family transcriptional regulator
MADGQSVSTRFDPRQRVMPHSGLHKKTRLHPGVEPVFATPLAALLTRNAMLKQALEQERAASAKMRRILLSQKIELPEVQIAETPVLAEPPATCAPATPPPQTGADDGGLAAGYPDLGYGLTQRQHQILGLVLAGQPSKNIAADLGISQRTVESHRAAIMHRTGATSLPALARLAIGADVGGDCKVLARP